MLRADGVVYFYLFLFNYHTMRDTGNARQTVCKPSEGNGEDCSGSASLRRAGNILARTGGIPSGCWICLKHRNEMNRNDNRCSCLSSWGHSRKLANIPIPNHLFQAFDQVGKSFSDYKPGKNWCSKCEVEAEKNSRTTENTFHFPHCYDTTYNLYQGQEIDYLAGKIKKL